MDSERVQAVVLAVLFSVPSILVSALMIPLASRAANGRLARNQWVGIRTPSTMRSDEAWMAGHRAALRLTPLFLATTIVTCGALAAAAVLGSGHAAVVVVGLAGFAAVLIVAVYSAVVAGRAAKAAGAPGDGQPRR